MTYVRNTTIDDCEGEQVHGDSPAGSYGATEFTVYDEWWFFIDGELVNAAMIGGMAASRQIGERGTMSFSLQQTGASPPDPPPIGEAVMLSWRSELQWAGQIENYGIKNVPGTFGRMRQIDIECVSFDRICERLLITPTFVNQAAGSIFRQVRTDFLADEGLMEGFVDNGLTVTFAATDEGKPIQVSQLLRDLAVASNGFYEIDPHRKLNFRSDTILQRAGVSRATTMMRDLDSKISRDTYRNSVTVRVKGTPTPPDEAEVETVTVEDAAEIAARQAVEGGTGKYKFFLDIVHPTSNVPADLIDLGEAAAAVQLDLNGTPTMTLTIKTRELGWYTGQAVRVIIDEQDVAGSWRVVRVRYQVSNGFLMTAVVELTQTAILQRAFNGWRQLAQIRQATVQQTI